MPETNDRATEEMAAQVETASESRSQPFRWRRTHTVWALIVASLIPGVVIAKYRDHWEDLSRAAQMVTYGFCAILIMVAVGMIIAPRDEGD
jgi:hypothetical protein